MMVDFIIETRNLTRIHRSCHDVVLLDEIDAKIESAWDDLTCDQQFVLNQQQERWCLVINQIEALRFQRL